MDLAALPKAGDLARQHAALGSHAPRWRPGLGGAGAVHSEVFASGREASGAAVALALALDGMRASELDRQEERAVLWVQDEAAIRLTGRPYRAGLSEPLRRRLIHVAAHKAADALFALEEGVRCRDLACVIGEIAGNSRELDFTASRRLSLTAERHGVPLFLVRLDAKADLSSARMRWRVSAAPSPPPLWNTAAPGAPAWHAELFRARNHAPGEWILCDDPRNGWGSLVAEKPSADPATPPDHGNLAGAAGGGPLAAF